MPFVGMAQILPLLHRNESGRGRDEHAAFNNDAQGYAVHNAADLRRYVRGNSTVPDAAPCTVRGRGYSKG